MHRVRFSREAEALLNLKIPAEWFECAEFAALRLGQLESDPALQPWLVRAIGLRSTGDMVGYIGFHTAPAPLYLKDLCPLGVEFGYEIFPAYRRQRYAWEASRGLMKWAEATHHVKSFVVSVSNDVLLMRMAFKRASINHPLEIARDGKQALEYLFGGAPGSAPRVPCLVLLDLNLPRVSGLEVLQRLRQVARFKKLPVAIFSSSAQPSDRERATGLGATEYIVKPSNLDSMVAIAKELDRRWLAPARALPR